MTKCLPKLGIGAPATYAKTSEVNVACAFTLVQA